MNNLDHIPENYLALAMITHINEVVIQDKEAEVMFSRFYAEMMSHAEKKGIKVSELFPQTNELAPTQPRPYPSVVTNGCDDKDSVGSY